MYKIELHDPALVHKGERLYIGMDISILCRYIADNQSIVLTPVLADNEHSRELPLVIINGRQRHRCFSHMFGYFRDYRIYKAIRAINHSPLWCSYRLDIPYQDWMCKAKLSLVAN
ncbi:uncharacterized protein DUF3868 [Dysgonomonas alginatilytica]|uniref:Uncharacterized protein DUF3868 n=1 Tax=Dysgonomonas alginatilytica TaxID=1605892 RepID=A0A2V3PR63_9BACT|nr:DUF3868 domain-containing protein [Dysgonomonas alginatilytica]PXV60097.1 uncharacterized protein DUF3868 [Dysgonomonas alginatilytica]